MQAKQNIPLAPYQMQADPQNAGDGRAVRDLEKEGHRRHAGCRGGIQPLASPGGGGRIGVIGVEEEVCLTEPNQEGLQRAGSISAEACSGSCGRHSGIFFFLCEECLVSRK